MPDARVCTIAGVALVWAGPSIIAVGEKTFFGVGFQDPIKHVDTGSMGDGEAGQEHHGGGELHFVVARLCFFSSCLTGLRSGCGEYCSGGKDKFTKGETKDREDVLGKKVGRRWVCDVEDEGWTAAFYS